MRVTVLVLFVTALVMGGCKARQEKIPESPAWKPETKKLVIYQVMTRLFGNKNTSNKPFGTKEENGVGKFNDFTPKALQEIKNLGATHVWFTGVIEHALMTDYSTEGISPDDPDVVKGRAGSPYSIKDYYDVNPDLAVNVKNRLAEFDELVERTHAAGLKVIIDFVPNHTARSYHSDAKLAHVEDLGSSDDPSKAFAVNNNFYYIPGQAFRPPADQLKRFKPYFPGMDGKFNESPAKATGDDKFVAAPPADSWYESAKLNYGIDFKDNRKTYFDSIPDTWVKMKDILVYWASRHVDGFRCDMAEMVPVAFWNWAIPQVRAVNPEILFIAEIYNPASYRSYIDQGRFDFLYDKVQLYDTLRLLINGRAQAASIARIQNTLADISRNMVHFLENHDEQRIASPYFSGDARKGIPGMAVSALIDPGPVLIYFGQEVGEPGNGAEGFGSNDGRTTIYDYWGVPEHQKWMNDGAFDGGLLSEEQKSLRETYSKLLHVAVTEKTVAEGAYTDLPVLNEGNQTASGRIVSFARTTDTGMLIVIAGFNPREEEVRVKIPVALAQRQFTQSKNYELTDLLGDTVKLSLAVDQGLIVNLPSYGTRIYKVKGITN